MTTPRDELIAELCKALSAELHKAASAIQECVTRLSAASDDDVVDATIVDDEDPGVTLPHALDYLRATGHLHSLERICTQACPGYDTAHFTTEAVEEAVRLVEEKYVPRPGSVIPLVCDCSRGLAPGDAFARREHDPDCQVRRAYAAHERDPSIVLAPLYAGGPGEAGLWITHDARPATMMQPCTFGDDGESDDALLGERHDEHEDEQGQADDVHGHEPDDTPLAEWERAIMAKADITPPGGGMHEHNGYAPHSHEVRADHQGVPPKHEAWRSMSRAGRPDAASPGADRDLCARCGNHFPAGQLCRDCAAAMPAREDTAEGLLSIALDLRMYGEGTPPSITWRAGSGITWREWDRRAEMYLRTHGPVIGYRMDGDLFDPGDVEIIRRALPDVED